MKRLFIFALLVILFLVPLQKADAKIWTKDLVDTVTLDSGYKFSLCSITMNYDLNAAKNAGFFTVPEKDFEGNPASYPCNKQTGQDILFANITLHFNKANGGGMSHEKVLEVGNALYSVDNYGDVFTPNFIDTKHMYADIAGYDWFATLEGVHGIRGGFLINTNPAAKGDFLPNSTFLVIHDPSSGKFTSALFILNNVVYKIDSIISQVTTPTTLVDYTQSQPTGTSPSPTLNLTNSGGMDACNTDSDCVVVGNICCNGEVVNVSYADAWRKSHSVACNVLCSNTGIPKCISHKCALQ